MRWRPTRRSCLPSRRPTMATISRRLSRSCRPSIRVRSSPELRLRRGPCHPTALATFHAAFDAATSAGGTIVAGTGDFGATDGGPSAIAAYPASDPLVTAVGGTEGNPYPDGLLKGKGKRYGGEQVWNEQGIFPFTVATGGAPSILFDVPDYQAPFNKSAVRTVADVSYLALDQRRRARRLLWAARQLRRHEHRAAALGGDLRTRGSGARQRRRRRARPGESRSLCDCRPTAPVPARLPRHHGRQQRRQLGPRLLCRTGIRHSDRPRHAGRVEPTRRSRRFVAPRITVTADSSGRTRTTTATTTFTRGQTLN